METRLPLLRSPTGSVVSDGVLLMDYQTFKKSVEALKAWRVSASQPSHHYPDSRDPEFQKHLVEQAVTSQDYEISVVCLCCWRENREDLYAGEMAIAHVINNRAKRGWNHGNQYMNVTAKNQFSSMVIPGDPQLDKYPLENDVEFEKLLENISDLESGNLIDKTDGSVYYGNLRYIQKGGWFERTILPNPAKFPRLATIGRTTYFGEK